jgi:aryl-alcohol dehydrogenase-like predicted oxidoreductase
MTRSTNASAVAKIDAVQAEYSAFETLHETDGLIDAARELGVAYVAYGPLGHGWLVDDFAYNSPDDFAPNDGRRSSEFSVPVPSPFFPQTAEQERRHAYLFLSLPSIVPKFQGDNFYKNRAIVHEIQKLAAKKGCTTTQVALAWVAAQGFIAIPGTTKAHRLEENWASRGVELTEADIAEVRRIAEEAKPQGARYSESLQKQVGH